MFPVFRPERKPAVPGLLLRRDTGPEQGARSESRRDSEGAAEGPQKSRSGKPERLPLSELYVTAFVDGSLPYSAGTSSTVPTSPLRVKRTL